MFEHSLLESQNRSRSKARVVFVPVAFGIHGLILAGVAVGQYWTVDPLAEPPIAVVFSRSLAPPPPAAGPPPPPAGTRVEPEQRVELANEPVQPIVIPDQISEIPAVASSSGTVGNSDGLPDGVADGVPWGVPNRSRDGVPNGVPHGVPGPRGDARPIHVVGDVVKPQVINRVQPVYTESARRARIQGVVIVETIIDTQGQVTDVRVLKSLPMGLTEEAIDAVKQWRFKPATLDHRPVSVYFTLTVNFELQ